MPSSQEIPFISRPAPPDHTGDSLLFCLTQGEKEEAVTADRFDPQALTPQELLTTRAEGMAGTPLPYSFRTDDYVTGTLLLGLFLLLWIVVRSRRYIHSATGALFRASAATDNRNGDGETLRGAPLLPLLCSFALGILFYDYLQDTVARWPADVSPYLTLGAAVAASGAYFAIKFLLYAITNHTFFDAARVALWKDTYRQALLMLALVLFPLTLLTVYFDLDFSIQRTVFLSIVIWAKIWLFFRAFSIFFGTGIGCFHIILYFCTLEIAPAVLLWQSLLSAGRLLNCFT